MSKRFEKELSRFTKRVEADEPTWEQLTTMALFALANVHMNYGEDASTAALASIVHVLDKHMDGVAA